MTDSNHSLLGFVERFEQHARSIATYKQMDKETAAEAKSLGFDVPTIRRVVRARLKNAEQIVREQEARAEKEALYEIYCASLGMLDGTPLGDAARQRLAKEFKGKPIDPARKPPKPPRDGKMLGSGERDDDELAPPPPPPSRQLGPEEIQAARSAGAVAHGDGASVLQNPYVAGDPRRAAWDEGWCGAAGSDGMEIPQAFRRSKKKTPEGEHGDGATPPEQENAPDQHNGGPQL